MQRLAASAGFVALAASTLAAGPLREACMGLAHTGEHPAQAQDEATETFPITGCIVFEGELPKTLELRVSDAQAKGCTAEDGKLDKTDRRLLIGPKRGIANCVVTIAVEGQELRVPEQPVLLDQVQCRFESHITIVPVGTQVEYLNSDTVAHNVHTFATKNKAINNMIPAGASLKQKLSEAEAVAIKCDIHPWMTAYIFVAETNFTALTRADGSFTIPGLLPGDYKLEVWHEKLGRGKGTVSIAADGASEAIEIKLALKQQPRRRRKR